MNRTRELHTRHSTSTAHRLFHYDGDCNNIHGHNMEWEVTLTVRMTKNDNRMPLDFKDVSDLLDEFDHAILLNEDDPLVAGRYSNGSRSQSLTSMMGRVVTFEGDPTCENVAQVVADRFIEEFGPVEQARICLAETDKYTVEAQATADCLFKLFEDEPDE